MDSGCPYGVSELRKGYAYEAKPTWNTSDLGSPLKEAYQQKRSCPENLLNFLDFSTRFLDSFSYFVYKMFFKTVCNCPFLFQLYTSLHWSDMLRFKKCKSVKKHDPKNYLSAQVTTPPIFNKT